MTTTITSHQVHCAYNLIHKQIKARTLIITKEAKENFAACTIVALEHLQAEFKLLEDYQKGLITHTELKSNIITLIEKRYKG